MSGYCEDCGNTACICPTGGLAATPHCADSEHHWIHRAQPDYPEWLAFIAYCSICGRFGPLDLRDGWQVVAVDAATPHLTADLVRERDEALAEVERLRDDVGGADLAIGFLLAVDEQSLADEAALEARADRAEAERDEARAEVERLRANEAHARDALRAASEAINEARREVTDAREAGKRHAQTLLDAAEDLAKGAEAVARAEKAEAAIGRVEALHPNNGGWCNRCRTQHPCATVATVDTHLGGAS